MTRQTTIFVAIVLAVAIATAGFAFATAPAAASHEDGDTGAFDALFEEEDDGLIETVSAAASGLYERVSYAAPFGDDPDDAEASAEAAMEAFNENSEDFVEYANDRDANGVETVAVTFIQDDEEATVVLVAEYNETDHAYDSAEVVTAEEYGGDVDETDEYVEVEGMAADNAADEIDRFHDEFAVDNENVTTSYMTEMATKYGPMGVSDQLVHSSLLED